jgi:hypothetical protein
VERWRQASQDANDKPVLTLKELRVLGKLRAQSQQEIKRLKQELHRKEKALAEAAALLIASQKSMPTGERTGTTDVCRRSPEVSADLGCGRC